MQNTVRPLRNLSIPLALLLALAVFYWIVRILTPPWMTDRSHLYLTAAIAIAAGVVVVRAVGFAMFDVYFRRRKGREAPEILRFVVSIIGYSTLFVVIYSFVLRRDLSGVLATSALVTVILGLALQDTLGNFFAGLSLHIEQPFHIGDAIRMGDILGKIESVTWRTTAIRTNNNSLIVIPNSRIAREPVEIYRLDDLNRRVVRFPAPYSVSPETVMQLVCDAMASVPRLSPEKHPIVRINEFAESHITYELLYWVTDYMWTQDMDALIRERVWYAYLRKGLEVPFPVRQISLERRRPAVKSEVSPDDRLLAPIAIFDPLTLEERAEIARSAVRIVYAPGEEVIRRGDPGESMFVIVRGRAEVLVPGSQGQNQTVSVLKPGDFFGEMALFTGEARTADVRALDELELLEIRKPALESLFRSNERLVHAFSRIIAERQSELTEYARAVPDHQKDAGTETILRRIKRFFSLK